MGKVKVRFFGILAGITGEKIIDIEALTIEEAIDLLVAKYGEKFRNVIYDENGKVRRFVNVYINGKDIRFLNYLNTKLNDGDEISIIPVIGGG